MNCSCQKQQWSTKKKLRLPRLAMLAFCSLRTCKNASSHFFFVFLALAQSYVRLLYPLFGLVVVICSASSGLLTSNSLPMWRPKNVLTTSIDSSNDSLLSSSLRPKTFFFTYSIGSKAFLASGAPLVSLTGLTSVWATLALLLILYFRFSLMPGFF